MCGIESRLKNTRDLIYTFIQIHLYKMPKICKTSYCSGIQICNKSIKAKEVFKIQDSRSLLFTLVQSYRHSVGYWVFSEYICTEFEIEGRVLFRETLAAQATPQGLIPYGRLIGGLVLRNLISLPFLWVIEFKRTDSWWANTGWTEIEAMPVCPATQSGFLLLCIYNQNKTYMNKN